MYIAKGTKVNVGSINFELDTETGYYQLISEVERLFPHLKVTGFKFISKKEMKLLIIEKEGDNVLIPKNTKVTFVANGEFQEFVLQVDSGIDTIEEAILEGFEDYREESLCFNGVNYMFPNITSGYLVIEGGMADSLAKDKVETWYSLKNISEILKLGIRKGDILHLKKVTSLKVTDVDYGNNLLCLSLE